MPNLRTTFHTIGAAAGLFALVGVGYLAGRLEQVEAPPPQPKPQPAPATTPPSDTPEVWTRMAGLNVWIAGKREERDNGLRSRIVVLLHGYGRPRETLLDLAEREAVRFGTTFIFPEANIALDWRRRAWWRPDRQPGRTTLPKGLPAVSKHILKLLEEVKARFNVKMSEIVLGGFSQGGTLAFDVALHSKEKLGGLALMSGMFIGQLQWHEQLAALDGVPVLITHGRLDTVAPFGAADKLQQALVGAGVEVNWVPLELADHTFGPAAQQAFSTFIRRVIEPPRSEP